MELLNQLANGGEDLLEDNSQSTEASCNSTQEEHATNRTCITDDAANDAAIQTGQKKGNDKKQGKYSKLSNETRKRIISQVVDGRSHKEVSDIFGVKIGTVATVMRVFQKEGRFDKKQRGGSRKPLLSADEEKQIVQHISTHNDETFKQTKTWVESEIGKVVSVSLLHKIAKRNHITSKMLYTVPAARNSEDVINKRFDYAREIFNISEERRIYVDEAGFNLHLRRRRGRNIIGERATVEVPTQKGGNLTLIMAITRCGVLHHKVQLTPCNSQNFIQFLEQMLDKVPPDFGGPVIIMDNVPFHKTAEVQATIGNRGAVVMFLPPYSCFLNPIEEAFSKVKLNARTIHSTDRPQLLGAVDAAVSTITEQDCVGWFFHSSKFLLPCLDKRQINSDLPSEYRDAA